jgi:DNA-binding response OmpR family regulator
MATILLVEDEADIRTLIVDAFEDQGLSVRSVGNDRAAYAILKKEARSFCLLVADVNLGEGTTGFDVARRARALNPDLKVIYIAGAGGSAQLGKFGVEGAELFPKPFLPRELADRAMAVLKPRNGKTDS